MSARKLVSVCALALTVGLAGCASGSDDEAGIVVSDAWVRATPPVTNVAAFYFTVENNGDVADALIAASSPSCAQMEVHESVLEGDVAGMDQVARVDVAAGQRVVFEPSGLHLMCLGLVAPLNVGDTVSVLAEFEHAGSLNISVTAVD